MSASPELTRLIAALRRQVVGPDVPVDVQRADFEAASKRMRYLGDVKVTSVDAGGVDAEWLEPRGGSGRTLMWLHGGGYSIGSLNTVRPLCCNLANVTGARVLSVDYRLAPEHPMPAAVEDAVTAYRWLVSGPTDAETTAIGGDSAGGGLAAAALLTLRQAGAALPAAAVFLSPWADLTMSAVSIGVNSDPMFLPGQLEAMADRYLAGQDPRSPQASPVYADLSGFPPMLIHVGAGEALRDDSVALAEAGRAGGADVTLDEWDDVVHVWHSFAPVLPEANDALRAIAAWLDAHMPAPARSVSRREGNYDG